MCSASGTTHAPRREIGREGTAEARQRDRRRVERGQVDALLGIADGVVDKKGAWLQFEGDLIGQGKEAAQKALAEKPALAKKIVDAILAKRALVVTT